MSRKKYDVRHIFRTMYFDEQKHKNHCIGGFLVNPTIEKWLKKGGICLISVEEGLNYYFAREFIKAMGCLTQVLAVHPNDKTAQLYVERCARFISQGVPEDWQGVEIIDNK